MSAANECNCACPTPEIVEVPGMAGADGAAGAAGADGINAYTLTTQPITLPGSAGPVGSTSFFAITSWMAVGQVIFISDGTDWAHFRVLTIPSATSATLEWLDYTDDAAGGSIIGSGSAVSPSGTQPDLAAPLPTALTDSSGGTASNTIAAGVGISTIAFHINLAALTTSAADLVTTYVPGYAFKILAVDFAVTTVGAGAGATQTINIEIGTTDLTGGVVNPTLANTATLGSLVAGTAVTANNVGTAASSISIEVAAGGTVFTSGQGSLLIKIQNMDTANAFASVADHINDLITSLT